MTPRGIFIAVAATGLTLCGCLESRHRMASTPTDVPPTPMPESKPTPTIPSPDNPMVIIFGFGEPDIGPAPLTVQFTISDPFMELVDPQVHWDFGDGSPPSDKRSPVHTYERPGKYVARVRVTDRGDSDEDTVDVNVKPPATVAPKVAP
jgi:hypothetical protein